MSGDFIIGDGDGSETGAMSETALAAITRSEFDIQIQTAKRYPRSVQMAIQSAKTMACATIETAASCFYKLPRDGKTIEGPSVRLAEIFASAWGNLRFGARIIAEDDRFITAQGVCHDLQTNVATTIEVRRRITTKQGRKFGDDMIGVTANAASSIALRNAILKVIPRSYIEQVFVECKRVAIGDAKTLVQRRSDLLGYLTGKLGLTMDRIVAVTGKAHENDIDLTGLELLYGLATAIKDGETTIDEAFPVVTIPADPGPAASMQNPSRSASIADSINKRNAAAKAETPAPVQAEAKPAPKVETPAPVKVAEETTPPTPAQAETPAKDAPQANDQQAPDVSSWAKFEAAVIGVAMDSNVPPGDAEKVIATLRLGNCNSARSSVGNPARLGTITAMINGQFDWTTAKIIS